MKQLKSYRVWIVLGLLALTIVGCDNYTDEWYPGNHHGYYYDDDYVSDDMLAMAEYIEGQWSGTLIAKYTEGGIAYADSFYVDYTFQRSKNQASGIGTEYTFTLAEEPYKTRKFTWYINQDGHVYIDFADHVSMVIYYDDFRLDRSRFWGTMTAIKGVQEYDEFDLTYQSAHAKSNRQGNGRSYGGKANTVMVKGVAMSKTK